MGLWTRMSLRGLPVLHYQQLGGWWTPIVTGESRFLCYHPCNITTLSDCQIATFTTLATLSNIMLLATEKVCLPKPMSPEVEFFLNLEFEFQKKTQPWVSSR